MFQTNAPSEMGTGAPLPPRTTPVPACSICGHQDETLRVVVYPYVFSLVIVTFRRAFAGIWCRKHRRIRLLLASLITAILGWIGIPYGLLWTPIALFKLARGGDQPADLNSEMLQALAEHKLQQQDAAGAVRCLEASLQFHDDQAIHDRLQAIRTKFGLTVQQGGCQHTLLALGSVVLGSAAIGTMIGVLDYAITTVLASLMSGAVPIYAVILSWTPFIAMAFIGGLAFSEVIEGALVRARCCKQALAIGISIVAVVVAIYGLFQGYALSDYVAALASGGIFESAFDAAFTGILVILLGGIFWGMSLTDPAGTSDVIYIILLLVIVIYYLLSAISRASRTARWQQRLGE